MFDKFKNLSRLLSFIIIFNFLVLNFGIKPKEVNASIIGINSLRLINYDLKIQDNCIVFDFSKYLSPNDDILEAKFNEIDKEEVNIDVSTDKKSCKVRIVLIPGKKYELKVKANIGGVDRQLLYNLVYDDQDFRFKPILGFYDNRLELDLRSEFINKFPDQTRVVIDIITGINNTVVDTITKTVQELKSSNYKVNWQDAKRLFNDNYGYLLKVRMNDELYKSKFYVMTENGDRVCKNLFPVLLDGSFVNDRECNIKVYIDVNVSTNDRISINSTPRTQGSITDARERHAEFTNARLNMNNDYDIRLERNNRDVREAKFSFCALDKIEKLNCTINVSNENNDTVNVTFNNMQGFFSMVDSKNKLAIYELNNDFTKGNKIGESSSVSSSSMTCSINLSSGKRFENNRLYLIELKNTEMQYTVSSTLMYSTTSISVSDIKETSGKVQWIYPGGYTPSSGDRVEIFLRDTSLGPNYSSIPNVRLVHGENNVNLSDKTSEVISGLAPGTSYEVRVELNNQRGSIVTYGQLQTLPFSLTAPIEISNTFYGDDFFRIAYPRSRTITVTWDFTPNNMEFSTNDKVEIFVKPNSNSEFSGYPLEQKYNNPVFTRTENLNSTKSAQINIPSWMDKFHVDLIYTIGGKKIITSRPSGTNGELAYNRRTVQSTVNKPSLQVTDITQTTAKVRWDYDSNFGENYQRYQPENGQRVMINVKRVNSLNDGTVEGFDNTNKKLEIVHGANDVDLSTYKELEVTGLEIGQCYRARVRHILQTPEFGFDDRWRFVDEFFNFKTGDFSIQNLRAEQQTEDSRKVKLTWGTNGTPDFGEGGSEANNIKVYLKEGNTSQYPELPLETTIQDYSQEQTRNSEAESSESQPTPTKQCIIDLPKYNTNYNVKVEYNLNGNKKVSEIVMTQAIGNIGISISNIQTTSATIKCNFPSGYKKKENDKVKLTVTKRDTSSRTSTLPNNEIITINDDSGSNVKKDLSNLDDNGIYDVILSFENSESEVSQVTASFKATTELQVISLVATDVASRSAKISWDFSPSSKEMNTNGDKVEIFIRHTPNNQRNSNNNDLSDYKKIYTMTKGTSSTRTSGSEQEHSRHQNGTTENLTTFKTFDLGELEVNKGYDVKVKYTINSSQVQRNSNQETSEAEVSFRTIVDTFNATVFSSTQTTAAYGWEYPPGYELQQGDKVEIFIKELQGDGSTDSNPQPNGLGYESPLLTLNHGQDENSYDLNEVTRVEVSGLTPEKKYKSKIKFTMGSGDNQHSIETEVSIFTGEFEIKSFEVDSYDEYDILVKWEIEPENMVFNPSDKLEIFVKLAEGDYPQEPSYKLTTTQTEDGKDISNTFSDFVLAESIGVPQKMKMVYTIGDKTYEKELEFTNSIEPIEANVFSVDETRALIEIKVPSNYEFVNGDALLIYAKDEFADGDVQTDNFLVFEGVQSDTVSIADDMKLIQLSYLLPEANYEVVVALDLLDGTVDPVNLQFLTTALPVSDVSIVNIQHDSNIISWDYGENEVDFYEDDSYDFSDKLIVGVKENDGNPIPSDLNAIKNISIEEYLGEDIKNVKNASISVEDKSKEYIGIVCYDVGGLLYTKSFNVSYLSVLVDNISSNTAMVSWKYPSNVNIENSDETKIFLREKNNPDYPESPVNTFTGTGNTSCSLENLLGGTEYIVKVQIYKEGLEIDPVEFEFTTAANVSSEIVVDNLDYELQGTSAEIIIPEDVEVNTSGSIGLKMGDEAYTGFTISFNESGSGVIIEPTIPKKVYRDIEIEIPLSDGTSFKMVINEFVTQPADTGQDWLSNAYWFAFERFPDEEGYNYWYAHRIVPKTLNGEYFLKNLLFAEDEFTNRNLQDRELIAALYQIVVNREYDEEGLNFWVGIYNENLQNAQGDKKLAQEVLVDRMAHEPEFGRLCENVGIFWRQIDQDAAGVPS